MTAITKTAIITGGGSGIGRAAAIALSDAYNLVLVGRRIETLQATLEDMSSSVSSTLLVPADLSNPDAIGEVFRQTQDQFGRLDVLFNNAGTGAPPGVLLEDLTLDQWQTVVNVNLTAAFLCTQAAFRIMNRQHARGGRIINIGSISAQRPRHSSSPYSTSKHAVWGLTQSLALEGRDHGIAVSVLHPGNVMVERRSNGKSSTGRDEGPEPLISTADMGKTALLMATLADDANMLEAIVLPLGQDYLGRG